MSMDLEFFSYILKSYGFLPYLSLIYAMRSAGALFRSLNYHPEAAFLCWIHFRHPMCVLEMADKFPVEAVGNGVVPQGTLLYLEETCTQGIRFIGWPVIYDQVWYKRTRWASPYPTLRVLRNIDRIRQLLMWENRKVMVNLRVAREAIWGMRLDTSWQKEGY